MSTFVEHLSARSDSGERGSGAVQPVSMLGYAAGAALAALLATAAMHVLLMTTPLPRWFFRWLGDTGTAIAVLLPLTENLPARWPPRPT
jgi:hypothetical protein